MTRPETPINPESHWQSCRRPRGQRPDWYSSLPRSLFITFVILLPFADTPLSAFDAFIPASVAVILISDLITSVLLYAQCSIAAFEELLDACERLSIYGPAHYSSCPGISRRVYRGWLDRGKQTVPWLFFATHFSFAVVLITYARAEGCRPRKSSKALINQISDTLQRSLPPWLPHAQ